MPDIDSKFVQDLAQIGTAVAQGGTSLATLNEARNRGNTLATDNQILADRSSMMPYDFLNKYGQGVVDTLNQADQGNIALGNYLQGATRTGAQAVSDTLTDVGTGFSNVIGGTGALAAGIVNPKLGVQASELLKGFNEYTRGGMSDYVKRNEQIEAIRTELDSQDNTKLYDIEKSTDGDFMASLRYVGRDFTNAIKRAANNPAVIKSTVGQGVGSLAGVVPLIAGAAAAGVPGSAAAIAGIAASEGGGAYSQSVQDIMDKSHEDLMQSSPDYRARIEAGDTPDNAKTHIAHNAGILAASIQAPLAAVTGKATGVLEFARNPLAHAPAALLKEPVEEAIQSFTGQVAQNAGTKFQADPDQNLFEGAGEQAALGAIGAIGSTAAVQAPSIALRGAVKTAGLTAKGIGKAVSVPLGMLQSRNDQVMQEAEAESPVSSEQLAPAMQTAEEHAPAVGGGLQNLATQQGANNEETANYINQIVGASQIGPQDMVGLPASVRLGLGAKAQELGQRPNKFHVLEEAANLIQNKDAPEQDKAEAATYILKSAMDNQKLFEQDLPEFLQKVSHDSEEFQQFNDYARIVTSMSSNPVIKQALEFAVKRMAQPDIDLTNVDLNSEDGQRITESTANMAEVAPQAINPEVANQILAQADAGTLDLSPERRRMLRSAISFQNAARVYEANMRLPEPGMVQDQAEELSTELDETKARDSRMEFVNRQIEKDGGPGAHQLSMAQHVQGIHEAIASGDQKELKLRVQKLGMFARSQINKVNSMNLAIRNGDRKRVPYQAYGANGWLPADDKFSVFYNPGTASSARAAKTIHAEASALSSLANDYAKQFPEFGIQQISVPDLVQERADTQRGSSTPETRTEPAGATTPQQVPVQEQMELPLPPTPAVRETGVVSSAEEVSDPVSTEQPENTSSKVVEDKVEPQPEPVAEAAPEPVVELAEPTEKETQAPSDAEIISALYQLDEAPTDMSISESYPGLVSIGDTNYLDRAFKFPAELRSRMARLEKPVSKFLDMFKNSRELNNFLEDGQFDDRYTVDREGLQNYQKLMTDYAVPMFEHIQRRLVTALNKDTGKGSILDKLKAGDQRMLGARDLLALNLMNEDLDNPSYNPSLMGTAVIAGLDWVLNAQTKSTPLTAKDVAELSDINEDEVTEEMIQAFNNGFALTQVKRNLADHIQRFWGFKSDTSAFDNYVKGIPENVAAEVLHALDKIGLVRVGIDAFKINNKDFSRVWFDGLEDKHQAILNDLAPISELMSDMALIDKPKEGVSIAEPVTAVDTAQHRNPMVPVTPMVHDAIENAQKTAYLPNTMVHDLVQGIGFERYVALKSGYSFKPEYLKLTHDKMGMNKGHWASLQGLQRSHANSFQNVARQMDMIGTYASKQGVPVDQIASYYKHQWNKLGRLQQAGLSTPQADKHAREVFMSTGSTLDLSVPGSESYDRFLMTIGQGIGLKTEILSRSDVIAEVTASAMTEGGKLRPLVLALKEWALKREAGGNLQVSDEVFDLLQDAELSNHGMHSLLTLANYENAKDRGQDLTRFKTSNYLEADGKTNGPINALMNFSTGVFTGDWLKTVAKGGAFFGKPNKALNSNEDKADLYQTTADGLSVAFADLVKTLNEIGGAPKEQMETFRRFTDALNVDFNYDPATKQLIIKRGLAKNPLTITVYGSGTKGIAGNIADELSKAIYEAMSQELQSKGTKTAGDIIYKNGQTESFYKDLALLTNRSLRYSEDKGFYTSGNGVGREINASTFELSPDEKQTLQTNVLTMLVEPMQKSIHDTVTQHTGETTEALQLATQYQSIVLRGMFNKAYAERLAEMKANPEKYGYHPGDALSVDEQRQIMKSLMKYAPLIQNGPQTYFLSGGEKSDLFSKQPVEIDGKTIEVSSPHYFSGSLSGDMKTPGFIYGATNAGVSAAPTLTIGSGDGTMMIHALNDPEMAARVLHVFDGMNIPADMIDDYSRRMNEAVFKTWTSDPNVVRAVFDSFATFIRQNPVQELFSNGKLDQKIWRDLSKVYHGKGQIKASEFVDPAQLETHMTSLVSTLEDLSDEIDIRRQVYGEFLSSTDQMASAESPYVNEKAQDFSDSASLDDIAAAMETRRQALVQELRAKRNQGASVEENTADMVEALSSSGVSDISGVRILNAKQIGRLRFVDGFNPTQKEMLLHATKVLEKSGVSLVYGSAAQLDEWQRTYQADRYIPEANDKAYGRFDPVTKTILLSNGSAETLVHELIHAATFDQVRAVLDNPKQVQPEIRDAVNRIDGLMSEWLQTPYVDEESLSTVLVARNAINDHLAAGRKAEAINEFMAWVLGNQKLAQLAQNTKVRNPIFRVIGDVLEALKTLIWGAANKGPKVGDSILSNLRFNTRILMQMPSQADYLKADYNAVALEQSKGFGSSDRLSIIRQTIGKKLIAYLDGNPSKESVLTKHVRENELAKNLTDADDLAATFAWYFPDMSNMQQKSTFSAIAQIMMTDIELNPNALSRIEELYAHVIDKLEWSDFRLNDIPGDLNDEHQAHEKYQALMGLYNTKTDRFGRSTLMSSFLALSMVSDQFRDILSKMEKPKSETNDEGTLDARLENLANAGMDRLSLTMSGERKSDSTVQSALDRLMGVMIDNVGDQRSYLELQTENGLNRFEQVVADQIQEKSSQVAEKAAEINRNSNSRTVKAVASVVSAVATMINEDKAEQAAMGLISRLNQRNGFEPLRALVNDIVGRTKENAPVWDMISKVRAVVQQTRQQFRELLPKKLAREFKKPVSDQQWTAMFKALGKTDIASLAGPFGVSGAVEMITSQARLQSEIQALESAIRQVEPVRSAKIFEKSKQLANYMNTGQHGTLLLRNAEAIARLLGVRGHSQMTNPDPQHVVNIDRLVSLYAIQTLDQGTKDIMADLAQNEPEGLKYVANYLVGLRQDEMAKVKGNTIALFNHYKGAIPSEAKQGGSLIIAADSEHAQLVMRGYKKLGAYQGSTADRSLGSRSYYFAPVSGTAPFSQGIMQTVHQTASGVDPQTGYTIGEIQAGRINDPKIVQSIQNMLPNQAKTTENLLPVYDGAGNVTAYERAADVSKLTGLNRSTHLADMIGAWKGRQIEELMGQEVNNTLVDNLHDLWIQAVKDKRTGEFVNIAALKEQDDPVLYQAAKLIPNQSVDYIRNKFGRGEFWVRRDMLLDALGSRQASVGDLFTGQTRISPKIAQEFKVLATGAFGRRAYPIFVSAEKNIQEFIGMAKQRIVVKSVIVPAANMISNMFQLVSHGVSVRSVIKGMGAKTAEINSYIKRRAREVDLEADLQVAKGDRNFGKIRQIQNEIKSLQDSYRRMSIWPLIEAGEFSAISTGQVTAEDLALADGKWTDWIEQKAASLPGPLSTVARYALVTRDTALYQGLARSVQYGDFIAKAILYDSLTAKNKDRRVTKEDIISQVSEFFVNYNRLGGRTRQWLESMGLLWFYNYKLRIMKVAAHTMRHNPVRALLMAGLPSVPVIGNIGLPVSDNILSVMADGRLGYSVGPNMGLHSFGLNPWLNLIR